LFDRKSGISFAMRIARKCVVVLLGLLAANSATSTSQTTSLPDYSNDPRLLKIRKFFNERNAPASILAEDFLLAADLHGLDWRLLPSIAFLESSGGKNYKNNNILGWDSCERRFPTVRAGIHHVAYRLAESDIYRGRSLDAKLARYNPNRTYPRRVKALMNKFSLERGHPATP
jgi:hypothetical protein